MKNTQRERGRDTGRGRIRLHEGSRMWDSILGLQDPALGFKGRVKPLSHPGIPHPDVSSSNVHNSQTVEGASMSIER